MGPQETTAANRSVLRTLSTFFSSWRFPVFALSMLAGAVSLSLALLLIPVSGSELASFAQEFRTWCFGYDPETGEMETAYVVMLFLDPLLLSAAIVGVWYVPLRELVQRQPRAATPYALAGLLWIGAGAAAFGLLTGDTDPGEMPFPAERLRTAYTPPAFELTDHEGRQISLESLRGQVVVLTGVYATCGNTCPMLMGQAKRAIANLPEELRDGVRIVAITLDPERDGTEELAAMATGQGVEAPLFRFATGEATVVNTLLDDLGIARERDPQTGIIDHANLFIVVDRAGHIAYRFTLGERQEQWLATALQVLAREEAPLS